ncbi:MAG TPA: type II and III secretion system protein family protein, partial [Gammaproteobacteria bacterium]|nr:type II and III secretion system protein family protein [Gammaproteobacteria bacterium]
LLLGSGGASAQLIQESSGLLAESTALSVPLYKSRILTSTVPVERVSVGNPDIADLLILRAQELYVLGKDLGTTNVLFWDRDDQLIGSVEVEVTHDLSALKQKLFELMPNENIDIFAAQRSIVLSGSVSSVLNMNAALQIAEGYLTQAGTAVEQQQFEQTDTEETAGEVINLMQVAGAQQVMLEVKIAEIARSELREMDMQFNGIDVGSSKWNFGGVNGGATFPDALFEPGNVRVPVFAQDAPFGPVIDEFLPNDMSIRDTGFFASLLTGNGMLNMSLSAARQRGLAKILAEPTLTTLSGQEAQFLSGGEFPIPVPQGVNGVTIEFKEFGVGLRFVPIVLSSGQISMTLNISVSELTDTSNVFLNVDGSPTTFLVPSLTKRSASATVELGDGQTIGIAGLINENLREVVNKFPGLGSIPILGNLFRSQEFIKGESELLIMVTPHLARPMPGNQIQLPTDNFIEPNDKEFYLMGRLEGKPREERTAEDGEPVAANETGGVESDFGHEL